MKKIYDGPSLAHGDRIKIHEVHFKTMAQKLAFIDSIIKVYAKNHLVREYAIKVIRDAGVEARDYPGQVRAIFEFVRDNMYYIWEHKETFQTPDVTIRRMEGDCDDFTIFAGSLLASVNIPVKLSIVGYRPDGMPMAPTAWKHIFLRAGLPPKNPTEWVAMETTIPAMDLGDEPLEFVAKMSGSM